MTGQTRNTPLGVSLISGFYVFGAIVLLICLVTNPFSVGKQIADVHGLGSIAGPWILPIVAGLALAIAYGLVSLARWGFILTVAYLIYFGSVNLFLALSDPTWSVHSGNFLWAAIVVIYLFFKSGAFFDARRVLEG